MLSTVICIGTYLLIPQVLLANGVGHCFVSVSTVLFLVMSYGIFFCFCFNGITTLATRLVFAIVCSFSGVYLVITNVATLYLFGGNIRGGLQVRRLRGTAVRIRLTGLGGRVGPRFLFGVLGGTGVLTKRSASGSSHLLNGLGDLLGCRVGSDSGGDISLESSVSFLGSCLRLRGAEQKGFGCAIGGRNSYSIRVPPLLFVPFIRGTIGRGPRDKSCIGLSFRVTGDELRFRYRGPRPRLFRPGGVKKVNLSGMGEQLGLLFKMSCGLVRYSRGRGCAIEVRFGV